MDVGSGEGTGGPVQSIFSVSAELDEDLWIERENEGEREATGR